MKKLLMVLLTSGLYASSPYVGIGGSFSNADDTQVECRISAVGLVGMEFNDTFGAEVRYSYGMNGDYTSYGVYSKIRHGNLYGLAGAGTTEYDVDSFTGLRFGLGYEFDVDSMRVFSDVIYREKENDTAVTIGVSYEF